MQLVDGKSVLVMKTNEFPLKIAMVKSDRKEVAGSGNLKEFFEVWLADPTREQWGSLTNRETMETRPTMLALLVLITCSLARRPFYP